MTIKDKLIIYLYNKQNKIDNEYLEHENYFRFRRKDENDYLECIIQKVRKDLISEIIEDFQVLLTTKQK